MPRFLTGERGGRSAAQAAESTRAGREGETTHANAPTCIVGVIQRDEAAIAFGDDAAGNPYGLAPGTEYHVMTVALPQTA